MRKNKTFEVTLLSEQASYNQTDNATFYTNDTEAYLNFKPSSEDFEFGTASIALYNRDDGSLISVEAKVVDGVAEFEMTPEIIAHYGVWSAQVVFKNNQESYTSGLIPFSVERFLMDERPPRLEEIVSINDFLENAQETFNLMKADEESRRTAEQTRIEAENLRKTQETARVQAEEARAEAEADRDAVLAGKADKVTLTNWVKNGDFSEGKLAWSSGADTNFDIIDGKAHIKALQRFGVIGQNLDNNGARVQGGDKWYFYSKVTMPYVSFKVYLNDGIDQTEALSSPNNFYSAIRTLSLNSTRLGFKYQDNQTANWQEAVVDYTMTINLTQTFGAGNEPSKEYMDAFVAKHGYFEELVLNMDWVVGEVGALDNKKANKKQEEWITPTLLNGWTTVDGYSEPGYMKDEFGFVHVKGTIKGGAGPAIQLPSGYRSSKAIVFPTVDLATFGRVTLDGVGNIIPNVTNRERVTIHISFKV